MALYVDSSALLKSYIDEDDSNVAAAALATDSVVVTSWITVIEVRRNLHRILGPTASRPVKQQFERELDALTLVVADERVVRRSAQIAEQFGVRSLDAVHLGSAQSLHIPGMPFLTFDLRQAIAARALGFTVLGA